MKKFLFVILMLFVAMPAMATESWLKPVEAQYVCMMNDKAFDKPQMAVEVQGKTYYGCCPMCKDMLNQDAAKRTATDPVSGKPVDKASAVIGADSHGMTYYFENQENFNKYASGPMPEMKHDHMEGMDHSMMGGHKNDIEAESSEKESENHNSHHSK